MLAMWQFEDTTYDFANSRQLSEWNGMEFFVPCYFKKQEMTEGLPGKCDCWEVIVMPTTFAWTLTYTHIYTVCMYYILYIGADVKKCRFELC